MTSTTERGVTRTTKLGIGPAELLAAARAGGFFSYLAGVAYQLRVHNEVSSVNVGAPACPPPPPSPHPHTPFAGIKN